MNPNDERGWVLAIASGVACALGTCLINLDLALHIVPQWRDFSILESRAFLAASLSLSFGVMFFSALFGLLPEAQEYFMHDGYRPSTAGFASIGFFLLGVFGIQVLSELLHRLLPSSIVRCDDHGIDERERLPGPDTIQDLEARNTNHDVNEFTALLESGPILRRALSEVFAGKTGICDTNGKCYGYSEHICALERGRHHSNGVSNHISPESQHNRVSVHQPSRADNRNNEIFDTNSEDAHCHIATNRYLSIGVQTSFAIALHKFPEGFITYATNHANPNLGLTIFVALFIHNIAEGFAMTLPLYLALGSRSKAILSASVLGGLAQPIGAGIAWISVRGSEFEINTGLYAILFSMTAGIMCSVGLQLFSQAIHTYPGSRLAFIFAFIGMGILGISSALTVE